MKEREYIEE